MYITAQSFIVIDAIHHSNFYGFIVNDIQCIRDTITIHYSI